MITTTQQLGRIAILAGMALVLSGCSIIDPDRTSGLQKLAVWQKDSERLAKYPNASEGKYNKARQEIRAYIEVTLGAQIDDVANRISGTIDLSEDRIPESVTASVNEFEASTGRPAPLAATIVADIVKGIVDWAYNKAKESRKASADALKKKLKELEWKDWSTVQKQ